jgi:hypothetical protein
MASNKILNYSQIFWSSLIFLFSEQAKILVTNKTFGNGLSVVAQEQSKQL